MALRSYVGWCRDDARAPLGRELCRALDVDENRCTRLVIDVDASDVVHVAAYMIVDEGVVQVLRRYRYTERRQEHT